MEWSVKSFGDKADKDYVFAKSRGKRHPPKSELALFRNFKMELYPGRRSHSRRESFFDPLVTSEDGRTTIPVLEVIHFALKNIKEKVLERLNNTSTIPLEAGDILWLITVPAIWNDFGKGIMRQAAYMAGIISHINDTKVSF